MVPATRFRTAVLTARVDTFFGLFWGLGRPGSRVDAATPYIFENVWQVKDLQTRFSDVWQIKRLRGGDFGQFRLKRGTCL